MAKGKKGKGTKNIDDMREEIIEEIFRLASGMNADQLRRTIAYTEKILSKPDDGDGA